jgi:HlyD family secretion protein
MAVGQPVNIQFQTFPFVNYGEATGSVRLISPDSFLTGASNSTTTGTPAGTSGNSVFTGANPTSAYFYDVRVSIDRLSLKHTPSFFHLTPGMPVQISVKVGNRTIWQYLTEKILPIVYEGMREPD